MKKIGSIYIITNILTNKKYIGQTIDYKKRSSSHFKTKKKTYLYRAMDKYGRHNFIIQEFVSVIGSHKDLLDLEIYYIKYFNTYKNGYNETTGGEGTLNYKPSKRTRDKLKKARQGRTPSLGMVHSEETRKAFSETRKGDLHPMFNKKQKESSKLQNLLSQKTRVQILCVETGIIYPSIRSAARLLNISQRMIQFVLRGQYKTAKGYSFKYI